jgi:peptidoglycan/xylan/chitin deacetylase (PgdA/CDA1 family)
MAHHATAPRTFIGQLVKELVGRVLVTCGLHHRLLQGGAIVVAFHSITRDPSDGALRCQVRDFESYCRFFARHLRTETYSRVVERLQGHEPLNGELSITFDDGYADNAELALDVLRRWKLPATFFVSTGFMETNEQTAWDKDAKVESRWMSWAQVKGLIEQGHEIGAHTVSHANLGELGGAEVTAELRRSIDDLVERTGITPAHFAIPYGRAFKSLAETVAIARQLGFRSVSLCRGGVADHVNSASWIERWPIDPTDYLSPYGWVVDVIRDCWALRRRQPLPAAAAASGVTEP